MHLTKGNFLTAIKDLVMGGGVDASLSPRSDAGFLKDVNYPLLALTGGPTNTNSEKNTVIIPVNLADLVNAATWKLALPYAFTVTAASFRTGKPATTAAKAATLTVTVSGAAVTGGVITLTSANQNTTGGTAAATAISGAGATGAAGGTVEVAVSSVTAFVEGNGYIEFTVTNNDAAASIAGTAAETNLKVSSAPASSTAVGTVTFLIPRDYDENTDSFTLHVGAAMSGSTDTPGLAVTAYRKRPGSAIATVATAVTGKLLGVSTAAALSTTEQEILFNLSRNGLRRSDAITIVISSDAHTTDALLTYFVKPVYRSTLVSYHETSTGNAQTGSSLR